MSLMSLWGFIFKNPTHNPSKSEIEAQKAFIKKQKTSPPPDTVYPSSKVSNPMYNSRPAHRKSKNGKNWFLKTTQVKQGLI